jgi:hypothetical protein
MKMPFRLTHCPNGRTFAEWAELCGDARRSGIVAGAEIMR